MTILHSVIIPEISLKLEKRQQLTKKVIKIPPDVTTKHDPNVARKQ